ncbi:MAG: metal ABC transporter permease [Chloroflexota bacterium]|nr:metal ABC transporter permease [Chloroflexota bacterium]
MLSQPFMRDAYLAGTCIGLAVGLVGYFLVLRGQVFLGDALSDIAFTGALAALAFGLDARLGLFATTVAVGLVMAGLSDRGRADDVVIGTVFAWVLGAGVLFLALFTTSRSSGNGAAATRVLFGSIFGLDLNASAIAAGIGAVVVAAVLFLARPLLFASLDPDVAAARGIPVKALGLLFAGLVGVCAAEATQAVGALLVLGLLSAPAGAAQQLTAKPYLALALSPFLAVGSIWVGLFLAYLVQNVPPSFAIMAVAGATYACAAGIRRAVTSSRGHRSSG